MPALILRRLAQLPPGASLTRAGRAFSAGQADRLLATHTDPLALRVGLSAGEPKEVLKAVGRIPLRSGGTLADIYAFESKYYPGTLGDHHERVIGQSQALFPVLPTDLGMDRPLLNLTNALHDIGKRESQTALATYARNDWQRPCTLRVIDEIRPQLPVSDHAFARMRAVISSSALGDLFQGNRSVSQAANELRASAALAGMSPLGFLKLVVTYNQADVAAYTVQAGGPERLDHVFARNSDGFTLRRDPSLGRALYNASNEDKLARLKRALQQFGTRGERPGG